MSKESADDAQFIEFVKRADPVRESDEGFERLKNEMLGSKARYQFQCQSCSNTITTKDEYAAEEGRVVKGIRRRATYSALYKVRSFLWQIPYIGSLLGDLLPSSYELDSYTGAGSLKKAKLAAYEEIKDQFNRCSKCGQYVCRSCFKNGKCADCSD